MHWMFGRVVLLEKVAFVHRWLLFGSLFFVHSGGVYCEVASVLVQKD